MQYKKSYSIDINHNLLKATINFMSINHNLLKTTMNLMGLLKAMKT